MFSPASPADLSPWARHTETPRALHGALLPQLRSIAEAGEGGSLDVEFVAHTSDLPLLGALKNGKKWGKQEKKRHVLGGKAMDLGVSVNVCVYVSIFLSYVSNLSV